LTVENRRVSAKSDRAGGPRSPLYARLRDELAGRIAAGSLAPGEKLPTVRALAKERSINPMTVAKAYAQLADMGLIHARAGSGSFVAEHKTVSDVPANDGGLSDLGSISSRLFELAHAPGVIAFTGNYPTAELSDAFAYAGLLEKSLSARQADLFRYDPPAGRDELREALVPFLAGHSIAVRPADVLVTSGGQQGMDIVARHLLRPGNCVLMERPAYFGAINVVRAAGATPISPDTPTGEIDLGQLPQLIAERRPKLIVVNPTFHNPTGRTMSLEQRQGILDIALRTGTPILEDDHCPEIRFRGEPLPPLRALKGGDQAVYYTRGFGKAFIPGVRLGFLIPPAKAMQGCLDIKATTDLQSSALLQGALADYLNGTDWKAYIRRVCSMYKDRQERLYAILQKHLGGYAEIDLPDGGLSFWLRLNDAMKAGDVYFNAVRHGVSFAVADSFSPTRDRQSAIRISFGLTRPEDYEEGVSRLASVLRNAASTARTHSMAGV